MTLWVRFEWPENPEYTDAERVMRCVPRIGEKVGIRPDDHGGFHLDHVIDVLHLAVPGRRAAIEIRVELRTDPSATAPEAAVPGFVAAHDGDLESSPSSAAFSFSVSAWSDGTHQPSTSLTRTVSDSARKTLSGSSVGLGSSGSRARRQVNVSPSTASTMNIVGLRRYDGLCCATAETRSPGEGVG